MRDGELTIPLRRRESRAHGPKHLTVVGRDEMTTFRWSRVGRRIWVEGSGEIYEVLLERFRDAVPEVAQQIEEEVQRGRRVSAAELSPRWSLVRQRPIVLRVSSNSAFAIGVHRGRGDP